MSNTKYLKAKAIERKKVNKNFKRYGLFMLCVFVPLAFLYIALEKTNLHSSLITVIVCAIIVLLWFAFLYFAKKIELSQRAKITQQLNLEKQQQKQENKQDIKIEVKNVLEFSEKVKAKDIEIIKKPEEEIEPQMQKIEDKTVKAQVPKTENISKTIKPQAPERRKKYANYNKKKK